MGIKLGAQCKIYRNSGQWETPAWSALKRVKDNTLTQEAGEIDVSTRDSLYELYAGGMISATVEFQLQFDDGVEATADREALRAAFHSRTPIELAILDDDIDTAGSEGLHADFAVLRFTRNEALKESVVYDISLRPTLSENEPEWLKVEAGA